MNAPIPDPKESFERYTIRAHKQLLKSVPDSDERNELVWGTWRKHRGATPEEKVAERAFSPDKYGVADGVCVFCEHETVDSQGEPQKYDVRRLAKIARDCNDRIIERRSFSAISDRHTANPGDSVTVEADVLGYSGPFRLGMIGAKKPVFAIFSKEYRFPGTEEAFRKKNRRSVELWTNKRTGESWFDPIATLGGDAPRLPLPAHYEMHAGDGVVLERYSCASGYATAGAGSTYVKRPDKYGDQAMPSVEEIVDAIMQTPQMAYVTDLMSQSPPGPGGMGDLPEPPPATGAPGDEVPAVGGPAVGGPDGLDEGGPDDDLGDLDDILGDGGEPEPEEIEEKDGMRYSSRNGGGTTVEKYAQIVAEHEELVEKYGALRKAHDHAMGDLKIQNGRLASLEKESADAKRTSRLQALAVEYPQFVGANMVDLDEEAGKCLYSAGSNMTDDEFDRHVEQIERYASRYIEPVRLPGGEVIPGEATKEQYAQKVSRLAVQISDRERAKGKEINYDEAKALAEKELGGAA